METINNLIYDIQIDFINDSGKNVTISKRIQDNGLEIISFQVGDVLVTEETINGRVLSGRFEDRDSCCGYRYDYSKNSSDYLVTTNNAFSLGDTVNLINKAKMTSDFLNAKMVFTTLTKADYKLFSLKKGHIDLTKSISASDENHKINTYSEFIHLLKEEGNEYCQEESVERSYEIGDEFVSENSTNQKKCEDFKTKMKGLLEIFRENPNNYKNLIKAKETVQQSPETPSI